MDNEDRESPSSSPVPGPSRQRPQEAEDDLSLGGEAEPYRAPDQDEELGLAGPGYRYIEDDGNSPAPSHSGLDADYGMLGLPQESPLSRHFDTVFTVSSSPSAPCSSSSSGYIQSSFPGAPMTSASTSRARVPGPSSDPVFSAHSQPLHNELLTYPDLPISSSWGVGASGQESAQMRPSASGWGSEAGASGLEQEVPGDLSLEAREDQDRSLQWGASSSNGMERPGLDYSEENSMEAEVHQGFNQYQSVSNDNSNFSPQPSSSASSVSGSMLSRGGPSSLVSNDRSLADILAVGPSMASSASIQLSVPGPSRNHMMSVEDTGASNSAKRPRSYPDSPSPSLIDQNKRLRLYEDDQGSSNYYHNAVSSNARYDGAGPSPSQPNEVIVISNPSSPQPHDGPSESIPISMANQINREIENCLREDVGMGSRSNSIDMEPVPGPSRGHQAVARASFGSVASSVSYLSYGNEPQPGSSRGMFGPQNNVQMFQPAEQGPPSPTGSEVLAAGPSRAMEQIDLQDSPSGSEVEAAGSNQRRHAVNNPNSPAPSESDPDEAGPSNQGYMVRFGRQPDDPSNREAAPIGRPVSPDRRARTRRNFSDACQISSSTGPVDSNPPTPEMFGVSGDIDYDYSPSPQVRRYNARYDDTDDAVVDSTVDSTNIPFVIHDYEDNEVRDIDDNDDDTEDESVAGSEASSTTSSRSRIEDHRLSLPGQDDNEGISTSGQVDVGQFRLVPNDIEMNFDEAFHEDSVPAHVAVPFQEEIEEIILDDNPLPAPPPAPQPEPQQEQRKAEVTFKKPFNRKERIMENVNIDLEPVAGPSGLQNRSNNLEEQQGGSSSSSSIYPDLRLGLAFSGLPSSLSQPKSKPAEETAPTNGEMPNNNLRPIPLKLKLKSRHLQEQLNSKTSFETKEVTGGSSVPIQYHSTDILRSSLERGLPSVSVSMEQEVEVRPEPLIPAEPTNDVEDTEENETNSNNFGGVQQNFSVTLETSNQYLSSIKPKRAMQTKSAAELKEYLPLDENLNNDDEDIESLDSFLHRDQNLDLEDSSYLTPKKAISQENQESKEAEETEEQSTAAADQEITIMISDQPVQSRAVASLPTQYLSLRPVPDQIQGQGVFAVRDIPVSCRFGPIEGRLVDPGQDINAAIGLALIIQGQRMDVSSEEDSNWMRFIRAATSTEDQNLSLHEVNGQLHFTSTRPIGPNEELRVWYSEAYATQHSLPLKPTEISTGQPVACTKKRPPISPTVGQHLAEKTKKDSGGPSFTCDICQRKFERQASLLRHLALHKGDKNYTCPDCGQKFSHTFNLERHRKKAHNTDPEGQHVCCNVCSVWFPSNMVLKVHMFSHHPNKEEQNWTVEDAMAQSGKEASEQSHEEMKFQCPCEGCECQYDTWLQLVEHAMDHGSPVLPSSNNNPNKSPVHKCELCYKIFANDARLKKHMAVHEGDSNKPLSCDDCGKRFLTNSALAGHVKIHAHPDTLYDCPMCGQEFEQVSSLKEHVYDHKENGVFTCQHCEKTFSEYPQIRKHIRAFHSEKRFPCTICDKSFTGKDKLKVHMVRHSEQKDFSCPECGKQFKRKDKLREHEKRMHKTQVDNNQPPVNPEASCSKFVPKVAPTELHRFIYKCQTCQLGFKRRGMLVNHLAKRHPNVPPSTVPELNLPILKTTKDFYCQYCNKVYKSSSKRKSHILKNHPGAALPAGARDVSKDTGRQAEDSTFSQTVGNVTCQPHNCDLCHKQYASKAKLLQHMRKEHRDQAGPSTSTKGERPKEVLYLDPTSPMSQEQMMEEIDNPDAIDNTINLDHDELFNNFIENHQGSSSNSSSLNVVEVESQDSLQNGLPGSEDNPIIRVDGDQEFIILQPGPSSSSSAQNQSQDGDGRHAPI